MSAALDAISQDALVLSPDERMALAYRLLVSVEPEPQSQTDEAWKAEIACRMGRFESGASQACRLRKSLRGCVKFPPGMKLALEFLPEAVAAVEYAACNRDY